ncbi:hypothetical protein [Gordonia sp. NPDC127522]|uniref:hypothetical protein n=1 Tax=Gordonia sp. NPDC127522 TaxID=3345390 RepID=UPI003626CD94
MTVTTIASPMPDEPARPAFILRMTGIADKTLVKAVEAGWIPDLSVATVVWLAKRPVLVSARTPDGVPIPALRMGVKKEATPEWDNPTGPGVSLPDWIIPREFAGLAEDYTDEEFFLATHRWWKHAGRRRIAQAGYLIVVIGGIVVGLLRITGEPVEHPEDARLAYPGYLIARLDCHFEILVPDDRRITHEDLDLARQMLGSLSPTRGGGSINALDADLDSAI